MIIYIIKGDMFVCLSVCIYVPYGLPNGWADRDQTWHTHSCPPRECFCQGQCQGHSRMRAGLTEVRNTRNAARKRHLANGERCSNYVRTTAEATPSERLRNSVRTTVITARVTRRGAAGAEQRAPLARVELRPEDGHLQLVFYILVAYTAGINFI